MFGGLGLGLGLELIILGTLSLLLRAQHYSMLKEYSSLQENPYNVRYIHTVLIVIIYFAAWGVDHV